MTQSGKRLEIDFDGWRKQQLRRKPIAVVKELISNFLDEDSATEMILDISPISKIISYTDNGKGFSNPDDVFRLYAESIRKNDPTKRGRFNRGEKEFNAVCEPLVVRTSDKSITFKGNSRTIEDTTTHGVQIIGTLQFYSEDQIKALIVDLNRIFVPEGKTIALNGTQLKVQKPFRSFEAVLPTMTGEGAPTTRKTTIRLFEVSGDERARIFEMGIPVQSIYCKWHVDIQQKIPLSPERDSIKESYLKRVYTEVTNNAYDLITEADVGKKFVQIGFNQDTTPQAAKSILETKFGTDKIAIESKNDPMANEKALRQGYELIKVGEFDRETLSSLRESKIVLDAGKEFRANPSDEVGLTIDNDQTRRFAEQISSMAEKVIGHGVNVKFVKAPNAPMIADYATGNMRIFTTQFEGVGGTYSIRNPESLAVVIHELAHDKDRPCNEPAAHGESWGNECSRIGAVWATLQR